MPNNYEAHHSGTGSTTGNDEIFESRHFETYKELKSIAKQEDPNVTKQELYEKLLKPFKHEKSERLDPTSGKYKVIYICKYNHCNKEFTKTWNLLDHVRMHEGIRPYECDICGKTFTQKGNLKKHSKQHTMKSLKARKRFKCEICHKKYTERYNLMVRGQLSTY